MAKFTKLVESLSEAFRRSGARSVCYFHADHFEPWRSMAGRTDVCEANAEDIGEFLEQTSKLDYARRLSLFLKPAFRLAPAGPDVRTAEGDGLGFKPLMPEEARVHDSALAQIAQSSHELQVHIHHEYYTRNDMYATKSQYNTVEELRGFLANKTTKALDEERFKLLIDMTLESYRQGSGLDFKRWFFVHGMWALNGSDRDVCTIDREIGLLLEKGCLGDFTFPAGRVHTDPVHRAPFYCRSVDKPKAYDLPEAQPAFAYGEKADGRFFIWSSLIKAQFCSIDYYSRDARAGLEDIERRAHELVGTSVFLDGRLYLKTHGHSMNSEYFENIRRPIYPHFHPGVQSLLGVVFDAAAEAGLEVSFPTVSEVYDQFVNAAYFGPRTIDSDEHTIRRRQTSESVANAMSPAQRLDAFAAAVSSVTREVVGERLTGLGVDGSGAYGYYADLYKRDCLIHPYELAVASYLAARLPDGSRIHEFGTGFGSQALLLAAAGFEVLGIDADRRRLATAGAIRAEVGRQIPWVAGRLNFKEAIIPQVFDGLDCDGVTAVATDVTSGLALADLGPLVEAVAARYESVIFDVERFFARTRGAEDMESVRALFARHYPVCVAITDAAVGRFFFHVTRVSVPHPGATPDSTAALGNGTPPERAACLEPLPLERAAGLINTVGVELVRRKIVELGVQGSGAGVFYAQIVEHGRLVQHYDLAVAEWMLENLSASTPILEVGAGVGALSLVLAAAGRQVTALDLDPRRIALGREIQARAGERLGGELRNLDFIQAKFPSAPPHVPPPCGVVVVTNMVFGWDEGQQSAMLLELARYESAIIDADRFGVHRKSDEERDRFDEMVRIAGLVAEPLNLVNDMRFIRLTPRKAYLTGVGEATEMTAGA